MTLSLSNLKTSKKRKSKRVGRGNASGRGTYSSRGMKGQRSRSGGKNKLKRKGLKQFLSQIPKSRGFRSIHPSYEIVNIKQLENKFKDGDIININVLTKIGLVSTKKTGVKILGHGEFKTKLNVFANSFSKSAENAIKKAGGTINIIITQKQKEKAAGKIAKEERAKKKGNK
ncbi:MAG: 50S ribosomal protein L15 [Candidatus Kerfeldbacteria bacterium]|jgi:large subunit ribosomal protein L15